MSWTIVRTSKFKRGYQNKNSKLRAKVEETIKMLVGSKDPRNYGRRKYGTLNRCHGYDLDFRNRLLYAVDMVKKEIYFLRVCSHKEVYGS